MPDIQYFSDIKLFISILLNKPVVWPFANNLSFTYLKGACAINHIITELPPEYPIFELEDTIAIKHSGFKISFISIIMDCEFSLAFEFV